MNYYIDTYKMFTVTIMSITVILGVLIVVFILLINELNKLKENLKISQDQTREAYDELAASDKELHEKIVEINNITYYDLLTQLPNKVSLYKNLDEYILNNKDERFAIIFIDVDNFKLINDTLGHTVGDQFLFELAQRLSDIAGDKEKVYRTGGDEFVITTSSMPDKGIYKVINRVMNSFKEGFEINHIKVYITVSAGVSIYPDHGSTAETLIMRSDIAMYKAKDEGKSTFMIYNNEMNNEIIERADIEINLRKALKLNELSLNYQPQHKFTTKEIIGFEALLRWNSKELGFVSPMRFIPVAEESHLIVSIGKWVLEESCEFIKKVHKDTGKHYTIAVNISLIQIMQTDFVDMVLEALEKNDLQAKYLELEVTETMLMENFKLVSKKLEILRAYGLKVALDDFGIGYSSLSYLGELPLDVLKIDKTFVDAIFIQENQEVIIGALINLGHRMGLGVVAEGVETTGQYEYLLDNKCDYLQGFLLSKPMPENEIFELISK